MRGMTLRAMAKACNGKYYGSEANLDKEVTDITTDSRKVVKDGLFIAICGERTDGHKYIDGCFEAGALCVISEKELPEQENSDRKSTRLNSSHRLESRMPSSA